MRKWGTQFKPVLLDVGGVWRQPFWFKLPQCSTLFSPVFCPWRHSKDHEKIYHLVNIFSINVFIFCTSLCLHLDMQSCPEPLVLSIVMLQWITTCEGQLLALSNPYNLFRFQLRYRAVSFGYSVPPKPLL